MCVYGPCILLFLLIPGDQAKTQSIRSVGKVLAVSKDPLKLLAVTRCLKDPFFERLNV